MAPPSQMETASYHCICDTCIVVRLINRVADCSYVMGSVSRLLLTVFTRLCRMVHAFMEDGVSVLNNSHSSIHCKTPF